MLLQFRNLSNTALTSNVKTNPQKNQVAFSGKGSSSSGSSYYRPVQTTNTELDAEVRRQRQQLENLNALIAKQQIMAKLKETQEDATRPIDPKVQLDKLEQFEQGELLLAEMDIKDVKDLHKFCTNKLKAYSAELKMMIKDDNSLQDMKFDIVVDQAERFKKAAKQLGTYIELLSQ